MKKAHTVRDCKCGMCVEVRDVQVGDKISIRTVGVWRDVQIVEIDHASTSLVSWLTFRGISVGGGDTAESQASYTVYRAKNTIVRRIVNGNTNTRAIEGPNTASTTTDGLTA